MEILQSMNELSKKEQYFLTKAQDALSMKDAVGSTFELTSWVLYTDKNKDGEDIELFSMRTVDDETYTTNSQTFISAFRDILDIFSADEIDKLKIMSGTSKNGRTYVTCAYAE